MRAAAVSWQTVLQKKERLVTRMLRARCRVPDPQAGLGNRSQLFNHLRNRIDRWPEGDGDVALLFLIAVLSEGRAAEGAVGRAVLPLVRRPILPRLIEADRENATGVGRERLALEGWLQRIAGNPDLRWVADWPQTEGGALGRRALGARQAFFEREMTAMLPGGGVSGWVGLARLESSALLEWAPFLESLLPPNRAPDFYRDPEASSVLLKMGLLCEQSPEASPAYRSAKNLWSQAWDVGWRPAGTLPADLPAKPSVWLARLRERQLKEGVEPLGTPPAGSRRFRL